MKNIKDFLTLIIYFIVLIISEIILWRTKDVDGAGLGGVIYFIYLFPLITFIISVIYSLKIRGGGKYLLVLLFGISIMLCDYITYDLAYKRFVIPDISIFVIFGIISLVGIFVGNLIKKCIKTKISKD